jgi:hypothetical protein
MCIARYPCLFDIICEIIPQALGIGYGTPPAPWSGGAQRVPRGPPRLSLLPARWPRRWHRICTLGRVASAAWSALGRKPREGRWWKAEGTQNICTVTEPSQPRAHTFPNVPTALPAASKHAPIVVLGRGKPCSSPPDRRGGRGDARPHRLWRSWGMPGPGPWAGVMVLPGSLRVLPQRLLYEPCSVGEAMPDGNTRVELVAPRAPNAPATGPS